VSAAVPVPLAHRGVAGPGPRPAAWWTVMGAFVRRDAAIAFSYRMPFVVGLVQSFLSLGFLLFMSRLVGPRLSTAATGGSYFDYAVVGSTLLVVLSTTLVSMAQRLRTDQSTGTLEVLFTLPPAPALTVLASSSYQVVYSAGAGLVTLAIAVGLGLRFHLSVLGALVALVCFALALVLFVALGVVLAAYVLVFKRGETLTGLAVTALSVVGGVYYPVSLLPHLLRVLAEILPFTWAVGMLRQSLLYGQVPGVRLLELLACSAVTLPLALGLFGAALRHAQRKGSLGQY
jgi:ABC-2 type transport system permease protein